MACRATTQTHEKTAQKINQIRKLKKPFKTLDIGLFGLQIRAPERKSTKMRRFAPLQKGALFLSTQNRGIDTMTTIATDNYAVRPAIHSRRVDVDGPDQDAII